MEQLNNLSRAGIWHDPIPVTAPQKELYALDFPENVREYISEYVDVNSINTKVFNSGDPWIFQSIKFDYNAYINLQQVNSILHLNDFLKFVNARISVNDRFVCRAESLDQRKNRLFNNYPKFIFYPSYFLDFIIKRVIPKLALTKKVYLQITKGKNQAMSFTQVLGTLVFTGFRVINFKEINGLTYFICEKEKEPSNESPPSLGLFFKMKRVGKDGKIINVYKIRTMHPYSEYLQKYVFDLNGSLNGDKITNDFRLAGWGKLLRKLWLDELPMILNLLKGDIKLVGVRPLSLYKFNTYPKDVQQLRISAKPGLVPPFYADLPETFEELVESEKRYLLKYKQNPVKTDIEYFLKCFHNIVIKRVRSA